MAASRSGRRGGCITLGDALRLFLVDLDDVYLVAPDPGEVTEQVLIVDPLTGFCVKPRVPESGAGADQPGWDPVRGHEPVVPVVHATDSTRVRRCLNCSLDPSAM